MAKPEPEARVFCIFLGLVNPTVILVGLVNPRVYIRASKPHSLGLVYIRG